MIVKIYYQDTDCGGVVYYANYLAYFERARTEWLNEKGISVKQLAEKGLLFVVRHAEVDYKSPAHYGEILEIHTCLENIEKTRLAFSYKIEEKQNNRLIVTGKTTLVCVDANLKPQRVPEEIRQRVSE
ncbi:MAG: YbgC/FadM family acyl-CoA thioesterase [Elusimicrobia bacterium]|nr:YbgC/FadM family acyl-CoA thioesterase [Elusimicrobiota bacterium]